MTKNKNGLNEAVIVRRLSVVSIVGNTVLSSFKLFAGIIGASGAMISDAVHSLSDVLATFIAMLGVRLGKKEADREHPYGHERLECLAALALGLLLAATGIGIGWTGLQKIIHHETAELEVPKVIALVAAVVSIVTKELMYHYTIHYADLIHSAAFRADAWHHRSDAFSSIGSLIGIGGAMLGFPILDPIASVVICFFILKAAYDILLDAVRKMLDTSCGDEFDRQMTDFIADQPEVVRVDFLRSRLFGDRVYIDVEVAVDGDKTLRDAHAVAEQVHLSVEEAYPNVKHIMVHVNPSEEA